MIRNRKILGGLISLFGLLGIIGSLVIYSLTYEKEVKHVKKEITYVFDTDITMESAAKLIKVIKGLEMGEHLTLTINSPGGSVVATFLIAQELQFSPEPITCKVDKMAASGAATMLLACPERIVSDNAFILFHLPYVFAQDGYYLRNYDFTLDFLMYMNLYFDFQDKLPKALFLEFALGDDLILTGKQFKEIFGNELDVHNNNEVNNE